MRSPHVKPGKDRDYRFGGTESMNLAFEEARGSACALTRPLMAICELFIEFLMKNTAHLPALESALAQKRALWG